MENESKELGTDEKAERAVDKLLEKTIAGEVRWEIEEAPSQLNSDESRTELVYKARYHKKRLRLYHNEFKAWYDASPTAYTWDRTVVLEYIDSTDRVLWRFPSQGQLWDLYNEVQYRAAHVGELLDDLGS